MATIDSGGHILTTPSIVGAYRDYTIDSGAYVTTPAQPCMDGKIPYRQNVSFNLHAGPTTTDLSDPILVNFIPLNNIYLKTHILHGLPVDNWSLIVN